MKSAIEELIFENSPFMEKIPLNDEYEKHLKKSNELYAKLRETLNEEQIKLLDKLLDSEMGMEAESAHCYLLKCFKTGIKLIIECL